MNEYGATVNVTFSIRAFGVAKVDTRVVTPPTAPFGFAIQYLVTDAAGNSATPAWRLVGCAGQQALHLLCKRDLQTGCCRRKLAGTDRCACPAPPQIRVVCSLPERYCVTADGESQCTINGVRTADTQGARGSPVGP